jgi:hypothetical protein
MEISFEEKIQQVISNIVTRKELLNELGEFHRGKIDRALKKARNGSAVGVHHRPSRLSDKQTKYLKGCIDKMIDGDTIPL